MKQFSLVKISFFCAQIVIGNDQARLQKLLKQEERNARKHTACQQKATTPTKNVSDKRTKVRDICHRK